VISSDYEELFGILNTYKVKYLVVGAHAVMFYTQPRFTKDMDVWIPAALNDPKRVYEALKAFGAPVGGMTPEDFKDSRMIFQIGVAPVRIDIMIGLPGVSVGAAWKNRKPSRYGNTPISILGREELIQAKNTSGRPQDKIDLTKLLKRK